MAHMMKKADFQALIAKLDGNHLQLKSRYGSVYLYVNGQQFEEVYCASNMKESGIISAMNQSTKYKGWM